MSHQDPSQWRLRTPNDIPYKLISSTGRFGVEDASATEVYIIEASSLLAFVEETYPPLIFFGGLLSYPIRRTMPGFPQMRTENIAWKAFVDGLPIDPFGADSTPPVGTYSTLVELTIEYKTGKNRDDEENPQTFLEISSSSTGEFLHTTSPQGKWEGDDQVADPVIPAVVVVPETQWSVSWPRIPFSFFRGRLISRMRSKLGKVNSDTLEVLNGAVPESVLFAGFSSRESYTWRDGLIDTPPVTLDMKFVEKHVEDDDGNVFGHQHVWRPGKGWQRLLHDGVNRLYDEVTMSDLFSPPVDEVPGIEPEEIEQLVQSLIPVVA